MRIIIGFVLAVSAGALPAQPFFECQGAIPGTPVLLAPGVPDCEGVTNTGANPNILQIDATPSCGMPVQGSAFLYLGGLNTTTIVPPGGPLPRPLSGGALEARIPIPAGASGVSFSWDFFDPTKLPVPFPIPIPINPGLDISVVDSSGVLIVNLVYIDSFTATAAPAGCVDAVGIGGADTGFDGPEILGVPLPPLPAGASLSVATWSGVTGVAFVPGTAAVLDNVIFTTLPTFDLVMSSPFGPGSLQIDHLAGTPVAPYVTLLTTLQGNFPNGAIAGIDISPAEIAAQLAFGAPPFVGLLDGAGSSSFPLGPGTLPTGLTLSGVSAELDATASVPTALTQPKSFTVL